MKLLIKIILLMNLFALNLNSYASGIGVESEVFMNLQSLQPIIKLDPLFEQVNKGDIPDNFVLDIDNLGMVKAWNDNLQQAVLVGYDFEDIGLEQAWQNYAQKHSYSVGNIVGKTLSFPFLVAGSTLIAPSFIGFAYIWGCSDSGSCSKWSPYISTPVFLLGIPLAIVGAIVVMPATIFYSWDDIGKIFHLAP